MSKLITIIAWLVIILISPFTLVIAVLIGFSITFVEVYNEISRIFDYQIVPYIRWKFHDVRKRFGKKDSN